MKKDTETRRRGDAGMFGQGVFHFLGVVVSVAVSPRPCVSVSLSF